LEGNPGKGPKKLRTAHHMITTGDNKSVMRSAIACTWNLTVDGQHVDDTCDHIPLEMSDTCRMPVASNIPDAVCCPSDIKNPLEFQGKQHCPSLAGCPDHDIPGMYSTSVGTGKPVKGLPLPPPAPTPLPFPGWLLLLLLSVRAAALSRFRSVDCGMSVTLRMCTCSRNVRRSQQSMHRSRGDCQRI
jgi:hypothetical protein